MKIGLLESLINSIIIIVAIVLIGLIMMLIQRLIIKIFASFSSPEFANLFINRLTFIGVVHHELSHALFAILTGAKITSIHLFKPKDDTLGSVGYCTRGPFLLRGLQAIFASIAPVICGSISCFLIFKYLLFVTIWKTIIFGFVFICIFIHMDLSPQDIKSAITGLPAIIIILTTFLFAFQFDRTIFINSIIDRI